MKIINLILDIIYDPFMFIKYLWFVLFSYDQSEDINEIILSDFNDI